MAWSYEESYVGLAPNFRRLCPFCGGSDIYFGGPHDMRYSFRCGNPDCGAVVHFERGDGTRRGPAASIYNWNRRHDVVE